MVLSRFWLVIFISAIVFVVFSLFAGDNYTIDHVLNGKKTIQFLFRERYVTSCLYKSITAVDQTMIINRDSLNADTRMFKNKTVKSTVACKNLMDCCLPVKVLLDLVLPLMAYLAFSVG
jgi:hypothetical protein